MLLNNSLAWNSAGLATGLQTGVGVGAMFSFRNSGPNPVLINRVGVGAITTTPFTAAQLFELGLFFARNWTVPDPGGLPVLITGNSGKHRTALPAPTSIDCRISNTGGISAGTRTLDAIPISNIAGLSEIAGPTIPHGLNNLFRQDDADYPLVLQQNEGIVLQNTVAMGAGGVVKVYVNIEFTEVTVF
jgi:hypothetical protein